MSDPIGTYTFLPWVRRGVANRIGAAGTAMRSTIDVSLELEGQLKGGGTTSAVIDRVVELYGPGDIVGIDPAQISRIEPENWITNFEPNYLVSIEFYDEDFPWRYSPAAPDDRRLLPWLALIVLEEKTEFKEAGSTAERPLPHIEVTSSFADVFPDAAETWAWAHAHFNAELATDVVESDGDKASEAAQGVIDGAPDTACSRLLCPRKLKPTTTYHAFLVPAFESGRLAGLGHDPKPLFDDAANGLSATSSAWAEYGVPANRPEGTYFPVYHRWYFRTSERGDFESLVRQLQPRIVDSRVGHRDLDVTDPAPNIAGIESPELGGILRLGGALKAPVDSLGAEDKAEFEKYDKWAELLPQPFLTQLAPFLNLADSYEESGTAANADPELNDEVNASPDPLITPPIYGRWHALTERLMTERDGTPVSHPENWVHDLNLDPRWRSAAGFGTKVVQDNQETYMEAAWDQIGDVLEANRRIRRAQMAKAAGRHLHKAHIEETAKVSPGALLTMASPLKARVLSGGVTVRHSLVQSPLSVALTSSAMRRAARPRARLARQLDLNAAGTLGEVARRANAGEVTAATPRTPPDEILTPDDLAEAIAPSSDRDRLRARIGQWLRAHSGLAIILLLVLLLFILLATGGGFGGITLLVAVVAGVAALLRWVRPAAALQDTSDRTREENLTPATVDAMPGSRNFVLNTEFDPRSDPPPPAVAPAESDNPQAVAFKTALREQYGLIATSQPLGVVPQMLQLDLSRIAADIVAGTRAEVTVPRWILSGLAIPGRIIDQIGETFVEAMAYPEFDTPMYEPLVKAGTELFVPNLHLVETDSVTLLETNQKFIEAYMVGLNHEFARELLWREYPTDQRGSYFRQFWDVRKKIAAASDPEAAREELKDIKQLHRWPQANDLGDNDNRETGPEPEEELVLVVRGELLKKYPNTIISAQPAEWRLTDGEIDKAKERTFDETVDPILPLYEARVAPDVYFFGFDLTALEARGDDTVDDKPGWFFRIEEVPGDARFGFDISREPGSDINVWNDLAWADVVPALVDGKPVKVADIPAQTLVEPIGEEVAEKHDQWEYDQHVPLDSDLSSAELAYISLQTPLLMAVHASELLPDQENGDV